MCVSEGIKAANIPRNGINGITARLAEVNSQYKNDKLKENANKGTIGVNNDKYIPKILFFVP